MRPFALLVVLASSAAAQPLEVTAAPDAVTGDRVAVIAFEGGPAACSLDGAPFAPCTSPLYLLDLAEGDHAVRLRRDASADVTTVAWRVRSVFDGGHPSLAYHGQAPDPDPDGGSFRIKCEVSHGSYDDPIVYPGAAGRAHLHLFLGNEAADYASTDTTLAVAGTSTCEGDVLNRSAYWVPTLLHPVYDADGTPMAAGGPVLEVVLPADGPFATDIYYKAAVDDRSVIQTMPRGLRMIAGDARASGPQDLRFFRWSCESWPIRGMDDYSHSVPACAVGDAVRWTITFPACWNGRDLDAPDHSGHMAYPEWDPERGIACPASHPVTLPQVSYNFAFPVTAATAHPDGTSRGWRLASDGYAVTDDAPGGFSSHGDWFMAWHPEVMEAFVASCLREGRHCAGGDLGNGWRLTGMRPGRRTFPAVRTGAGPHPMGPAPAPAPAASLLPPAPNPFRAATEIRYSVASPGRVRLAVYDVLGREVARLADAPHAAGVHARPLDGAALAPGLYVVRLTAAGRTDRRVVTRVD